MRVPMVIPCGNTSLAISGYTLAHFTDGALEVVMWLLMNFNELLVSWCRPLVMKNLCHTSTRVLGSGGILVLSVFTRTKTFLCRSCTDLSTHTQSSEAL